MCNDSRYLKLAIEQALNSNKHTRVGCIIVKQGVILARACNTDKSHPIQALLNLHRFNDDCCKHSLHAEINAILKVKDPKKLIGASIYIARLDKHGNIKSAFPCNACLALIKQSRIKKIIYT